MARSASRNATPLILCNWTTRTRSPPVRLTNSQAMPFLVARSIPSPTVPSSRWRTTGLSKCQASSRKASRFRWRWATMSSLISEKDASPSMRTCSRAACLVVLLCAAPANPDRHVNAGLARMDAIAALAHSDAALAGPEVTSALAPLAEPEVNVSPLQASDECGLSEGCIDQYLWSVYECAPKVDTIKVQAQIKT